jgi:hypothetical protein
MLSREERKIARLIWLTRKDLDELENAWSPNVKSSVIYRIRERMNRALGVPPEQLPMSVVIRDERT